MNPGHIPATAAQSASPGGGRIIALFGGGRWGRVHASNLSRILTAGDRVLWISAHNRGLVSGTIEGLARPGAPRFELSSSVEEALRERPHAAIVVTAPSSHSGVAERCLRSGVHTFVEKPLALRPEEARTLVDIAERENLVLAVGLHLLSASFLHHLKSLLPRDDIAELSVRWFDPENEIRYGEEKRGDAAATVAHDVYPHVWSLIRSFGSGRQSIEDVAWLPGGTVSFNGRAGKTAIAAQIGRLAVARERVIKLRLKGGASAELDFTKEPGVPVVEGVPRAPDPDWGRKPAPVMAEVMEFLRRTVEPESGDGWPHLASACIDSVADTQRFASRLVCAATGELRSRIRIGTAPAGDAETRALIWETIVHPLAERGLSVATMDTSQQQLLLVEALRLQGEAAAFADDKRAHSAEDRILEQLISYAGRLA